MATKDNNPAFNFQILASDKRHEPSPDADHELSSPAEAQWHCLVAFFRSNTFYAFKLELECSATT